MPMERIKLSELYKEKMKERRLRQSFRIETFVPGLKPKVQHSHAREISRRLLQIKEGKLKI